MQKFRLLLAVWVGKLAAFMIRTFRLKGGTYLPGKLAQRIDPQLLRTLALNIPQHVMITGTNGKTTTTGLLSHFVDKCHIKMVYNETGANLKNGILTQLLKVTNVLGAIQEIKMGIWEVDERAFNTLVGEMKPLLIVFLNAFRDQMDRYGEVDRVISDWKESLKKCEWKPKVLINSSHLNLLSLLQSQNIDVHLFNMRGCQMESDDETSDLEDLGTFESADVEGIFIQNKGLKGSQVLINYPGGRMDLALSLPGAYQTHNLAAAFAAYYYLNLPIASLQKSLSSFVPKFGRTKALNYRGYEIMTILIKNPIGADQVFYTLAPEVKEQNHLFMILNDHELDGQDISWIWDANFEHIAKSLNQQEYIWLSGSRAADLAVRLKYADVAAEKIKMNTNIGQSLNDLLSQLKFPLFILSTYSGLLELERHFIDKGIQQPYWSRNK